ncbi:MAG TPA: helix-turn-helix domain-containing protein [Solirubrobacter sp.]
MGSTAERSMRSDARRNRARLIEVAAAAFRDEGLDIGVDELARRTGVGVATLYRHFPAKTDLISAVMGMVFDELQDAASAALAADDVLARFLHSTVAVQCQNRGFLQALAHHDLPEEVRDGFSRRALEIFEPIVAAAQAAGTFRAELDAVDLLVVVRMLGAISTRPERRGADAYIAALLRGLAQ